MSDGNERLVVDLAEAICESWDRVADDAARLVIQKLKAKGYGFTTPVTEGCCPRCGSDEPWAYSGGPGGMCLPDDCHEFHAGVVA